MKMKRKLSALAVAGVLGFAATSAQAAVFQFNAIDATNPDYDAAYYDYLVATGQPITGAAVQSADIGIIADELTFAPTTPASIKLTDTSGSGGMIGPADDFVEVTLLSTVSFSLGGAAIGGTQANDWYEMMAEITLRGTADMSGGDLILRNLSASTGTMWYDNTPDGILDAGDQQIASLWDPVGGCEIALNGGGNCNMYWKMDDAGTDGVWQRTDGTGDDLDYEKDPLTFLLSLNVESIDGIKAYYEGYGDTCGTDTTDACTQEGTVNHNGGSGKVPEPATLALLGGGLLGMAGFGRRRRKS